MLSDEEKKAIDYLQLCYDLSTITNESLSKLGIVLNLIEKQSKEIEELKEDKYGLEEEVQMQAKNIILCESALCEIQDKIKAKIEELKDGTYDAKIILQLFLKDLEVEDD